MHGCDARNNHAYRVPKRAIKIRNEAGQLQQSGLMIGVKDGSAVLTSLNGSADHPSDGISAWSDRSVVLSRPPPVTVRAEGELQLPRTTTDRLVDGWIRVAPVFLCHTLGWVLK